jgi:hypothetical protein
VAAALGNEEASERRLGFLYGASARVLGAPSILGVRAHSGTRGAGCEARGTEMEEGDALLTVERRKETAALGSLCCCS